MLNRPKKGLEQSLEPLFYWPSAAKQGFFEPFRRLLRLQPEACWVFRTVSLGSSSFHAVINSLSGLLDNAGQPLKVL